MQHLKWVRVPPVLRFLSALIVVLYVQCALVVAVVLSERSSTWALPVLGVGVALVSVTPLVAGTVVSYTTWSEDESRRRIRRAFGVLLLVQLIGAASVAAAGLAAAVPVGVVVAVVVGGLALTPALIGIGRVARRLDTRWRSVDEWVDTTRADIRRGYRNAGIGFAIGLAVAVLLVAVLTATLDGRARVDIVLLFDGFAVAVMGAAAGMIVSSFRIARHLREATGHDYGAMRRINRVVLRGKQEQLSEDEHRRARRYAAVVSQWLPYQAVQLVLLYGGMVIGQAGGFFSHQRAMDPLRIGMIVLLLLVTATLLPLTARNVKRARNYAAAAPSETT